jgi:aspartate-semialdehyde dehydrogenase
MQIQTSMSVQDAGRDQEKEKTEVKVGAFHCHAYGIFLMMEFQSPSIAEQTARDAPMSLIQEIRENMALPQQPCTALDISEDSIIGSILSEKLASILLSG